MEALVKEQQFGGRDPYPGNRLNILGVGGIQLPIFFRQQQLKLVDLRSIFNFISAFKEAYAQKNMVTAIADLFMKILAVCQLSGSLMWTLWKQLVNSELLINQLSH